MLSARNQSKFFSLRIERRRLLFADVRAPTSRAGGWFTERRKTNIENFGPTGATHRYLSKIKSSSSTALLQSRVVQGEQTDHARALVVHTTHLLRCPPPAPPPCIAPRCPPPLSIRRYITPLSHESTALPRSTLAARAVTAAKVKSMQQRPPWVCVGKIALCDRPAHT